MDIQALKTEIDTDPLARGYSGMSDEQIAISLNDTIDRTRNKSSLTGDEIFEATDTAEYGALTEHKQAIWVAFCGRDSIDPFGSANVALVQWVFGGGSTSVSNLNSLRVESVSRGVELGLGRVRLGDVQQAKLLP